MKDTPHFPVGMWQNLILICALWLGISNGQLALWETNGQKPLATFPISAASLPQCDQKALEYGIPISDLQTLFQRLEDFS